MIFFSYIKAIQLIHNILTANNKIPSSCKTVLLSAGQQFIDLLPAIELLTCGHWFNQSREIDVTMSMRRPDSRT